MTESNRRHSACKADALPTELITQIHFAASAKTVLNQIYPNCTSVFFNFFTYFDNFLFYYEIYLRYFSDRIQVNKMMSYVILILGKSKLCKL